MLAYGVKRVICLLHESELAFYAQPLALQYSRHFSRVDMIDFASHAGKDSSFSSLIRALLCAEQAQEKVVVHCSTVR
jgi:hypothetical protein